MRNSPFLAAGPMGKHKQTRSSYRNDEDCYVDEYLVEKLERKRDSVMQLMNKAEEKQFTQPDIKKWLVSIKHTMYDANALLDKIDTEKQFREKYKEDGSASYPISGFVHWATSEINRIIEELKELKEEAGDMGLKARDEGAAASAQQTRIPNDRVTSPVLGKSTIVYGREKEKARILKQVLYSPEPAAPGNKPKVIAIVGMGGIGKTTLAQYVYNHADVKSCFTRSWACVSDNFDLVRVTRAILEYLTEIPVGVCELASLQQQLEKQLTGKRFLVVLDDTWDFSKQNWEKLMAPFSTGAAGSKIILTTRDRRVVGVVPADHSFQLEPMSEDEAWSLFSCEVFRDGELSQHPKLETMGKEIVKKCGGSPLAIKTLSGLLRSERKEVEWERVRESSLWQLPEDYEFQKEELVNLWVDEGFLPQSNDNRSIEDVGVASFEDLSSRSFFTHYHKEVYVMHDLIHDLAQMAIADFHQQLNGHKAVKECKKVRHISFHDTSECGSPSKFEGLNQAESLQTFMAPRYVHGRILDDRILKDVLLQQLSLRVLCLRGARIRTLPDTIGNLKQLRHLDVSYSDVEVLPDSLRKLYNLRSLLCESCDQIKEFHYDMADFVSLRQFSLSGSQLQKLPWNLSQLSRVKLEFILPYSVGDGSDSSGSRDMKEGLLDAATLGEEVLKTMGLDFDVSTLFEDTFMDLDFDVSTLAEDLSMRLGFDYSTLGEDAFMDRGSGFSTLGEDAFMDLDSDFSTLGKDAFMDRGFDFFTMDLDSDFLKSLPLAETHVEVRIDKSTFLLKFVSLLGEDAFIGSDLLKSLRPHRDVKEVLIGKFNGTEFPGWLVDRSFCNIERLDIRYCDSFECFPADDSLPTSLTFLRIWGFEGLKKLDIFGLRSLINLEGLEISKCPLLESLGYSSNVDDSSSDDEFSFNSSLRILVVRRCENLKAINGAWLRSFTSLEELSIYYCRELKALPVKLPSSLKRLTLHFNHPDLKKRCKKDTGLDWPNIAHVPGIVIW